MYVTECKAFEEPGHGYARDDKVEAMVVFLTESHLDVHGGYPFDHAVLRGVVIVAGFDEGKDWGAKTEITIHRQSDLVKWYDRAVDFLAEEGDDFDFVSALYETATNDDWRGR